MTALGAWARSRPLADDLVELVAIDTTTPHERRALPWLEARLERLGFTPRREPFHPLLAEHAEATRHAHDADPGRCNLHAALADAPRDVPVTLFSAHLDVVPPGPRFPEAFAPRERGGVVVGRGAADTKNNIVMLLAALEYVRDAGLPLRRAPLLDFVSEEEIGGGGALSTLLHGRMADEVVVLEPTSLDVHHGHRGCLGFEVTVRGDGGHMGAVGAGGNPIERACEVVAELKGIEAAFLHEARDDPDFARWPRPVQLNIGSIAGGQWHGSVPEECVLKANLGFLPRYECAGVRTLLERRLAAVVDARGRPVAHLTYEGIHNEGYRTDPGAEVFGALARARAGASLPPRPPSAWHVSCDARLYARHLGVPTAIFGSGLLAQAHSPGEHVEMAEIARGAEVLARFLTGQEPG